MRKISWAGIAILVLGVFLLLSNLNLLPYYIGFNMIWPLLLFLFSVSSMADARRITLIGSIGAAGAIYWGLYQLRMVPALRWDLVWPAILILIGVNILVPALWMRNRRISTTHEGADSFSSTAIFSGDERILGGDVFGSGDVTAIFGGCDLTLSDYRAFAPRSNIQVTVLFGGAELRIPRSVRVHRQGLTCLFGGLDIKGSHNPDATDILYLSGTVLFGGLEIRYIN